MPVIGLLLSTQLDDRQLGAIRHGLRDAGYIEGRNVAIKYRSGDGRFDRLPALAVELVVDAPAAIVALAPAASLVPWRVEALTFLGQQSLSPNFPRSVPQLMPTRETYVLQPARWPRRTPLR